MEFTDIHLLHNWLYLVFTVYKYSVCLVNVLFWSHHSQSIGISFQSMIYCVCGLVLCRRTTCLKYLVLANMLMKSGINPFDSQEAKPYKNNPEILAMTNLVRWPCNDLLLLINCQMMFVDFDDICAKNVNWFLFCDFYFSYLCVWLIFSAYQNNDITEFEKILKTNRETIMEDPFIREHIEGE